MDYTILGGSMQAVSIHLADGEKIYADSGKLVSKSEKIKMEPRLVGGIVNAIERKVTGATAMLTVFTANGSKCSVSLSGIMPGKIRAITLAEGEVFVSEDYAFLAAEESVKFTMETIGLGAAFFGGAGLILQKFVGPGTVFLHVVGDIVEYDLDGTVPLEVDPGHIAGFSGGLNYKITFVDNIRTAMFGGVGLFLAKFTGKGKVILHSVSRRKLSSDIYIQGYEQAKGDSSGK